MKILDILVPAVCIGVILFSGFKLYQIYKSYAEAAAIYDGVALYVKEEAGVGSEDAVAMMHAGFPYLDIDYDSLLDVGCGTGFLIDLLAKDHMADYIGLDLSPEMIRMAKLKNIQGASFFEGTADKLPFPDEVFDIVTCSQSFHHYPYQKKAMEEAYRVLRKGGIYILSDTGIGGIGAWIDNHILFKLARSGDCHTMDRRGIGEMMESVGFKVEDSRQIRKLIYTVKGMKTI